MTRKIAKTAATFTEDSIVARIEFKPGQATLGHDILAMCQTLDDVQRCAAMGDFRVSYDIKAA